MTQQDPAGRDVGLGRVVEDHLSTGSPDPDDPGGPDAPPGMRDGDRDDAPAVDRREPDPERDVVDASAQSFPASDPPTFMSDPATPRDRDAATLPDDAAG